MNERLLGLETEYALTALDRNQKPFARDKVVGSLMNLAREKLTHLPSLPGRNDIFLPSGRFYIDCGLHPEFACAECSNPSDVVRYVLAGDQILANLAKDLEKDNRFTEIILHKCNVDYSGTGNTWGCHESYLHEANPEILFRQIVPHLVSRIIYTGAGGFEPLSPDIEFTLSPRVAHLVCEKSNSSTESRGIFHTKDEPLCLDRYHRLHLLCGESLCSHLAAWLKMATTGLVVSMIEAGLDPGNKVMLPSPLKAMRTFAHDTKCKVEVKSISGKFLSALAIQRHYLKCAEAHLDDEFMPSWAKEACRKWRAILNQLEDAPVSVSTTLDWAIKLSLYKDYVQRHSDIETKSMHDSVRIRGPALNRHNRIDPAKFPISRDFLNPFETMERNAEYMHHPDRKNFHFCQDTETFYALKCRLFEIDTRFSQLGENGIFTSMDKSGVLTHRLVSIAEIENAISNPPETGRANLRGNCIKRLSGNSNKHMFACYWDWIYDYQNEKYLDLSEPFAKSERWGKISEKTALNSLPRGIAGIPGVIREYHRVHRRERVERENSYDNYAVGDHVVIVRGRHPGADSYVGQITTITRITSDYRGPKFYLALDCGRGAWRLRNFRPASSAGTNVASGERNCGRT